MNVFTFTTRLFIAALLYLGCPGGLNAANLFGGNGKPDNIFVASPVLPAALKRVVVLPLAHQDAQADLSSGCDLLDPILQAELIKTKRFEMIAASPKTIQELTGQARWTGEEVLPPDFFGSLQRVYGCDAVLFCELTTYHAYPPLLIGWRMKLVDVSTQKIIWAADVVFDASDPAVSQSAEAYQKQQQGVDKPVSLLNRMWTWIDRRSQPATDDQWTILNSPRYFGEFAATKLFDTLPQR